MTLAPPAPLLQFARAGLVRPLSALPVRAAPTVTGLPVLDALLGGGLPRGALTVLAGGASSGAAALALQLAASLGRTGRLIAWIDAARGFDPAAARHSGLDPAGLLLVRPVALPEALSVAYDLLCEGSAGLVLLDTGGMTPSEASLRLLANAVVRGQTALVWLVEPAVLIPQAELRLSVARLGWETAGGDAFALRARVTVEAGRGTVGRRADLVLPVDEVGPCWSAP